MIKLSNFASKRKQEKKKVLAVYTHNIILSTIMRISSGINPLTTNRIFFPDKTSWVILNFFFKSTWIQGKIINEALPCNERNFLHHGGAAAEPQLLQLQQRVYEAAAAVQGLSRKKFRIKHISAVNTSFFLLQICCLSLYLAKQPDKQGPQLEHEGLIFGREEFLEF